MESALAAARKNLDLAPHSADSYALMMRIFQLSGDYNTALEYGNHAININHFDSNNMHALADLLDEMKKPTKADEMRKQANALSIPLIGTSL